MLTVCMALSVLRSSTLVEDRFFEIRRILHRVEFMEKKAAALHPPTMEPDWLSIVSTVTVTLSVVCMAVSMCFSAYAAWSSAKSRERDYVARLTSVLWDPEHSCIHKKMKTQFHSIVDPTATLAENAFKVFQAGVANQDQNDEAYRLLRHYTGPLHDYALYRCRWPGNTLGCVFGVQLGFASMFLYLSVWIIATSADADKADVMQMCLGNYNRTASMVLKHELAAGRKEVRNHFLDEAQATALFERLML